MALIEFLERFRQGITKEFSLIQSKLALVNKVDEIRHRLISEENAILFTGNFQDVNWVGTNPRLLEYLRNANLAELRNIEVYGFSNLESKSAELKVVMRAPNGHYFSFGFFIHSGEDFYFNGYASDRKLPFGDCDEDTGIPPFGLKRQLKLAHLTTDFVKDILEGKIRANVIRHSPLPKWQSPV